MTPGPARLSRISAKSSVKCSEARVSSADTKARARGVMLIVIVCAIVVCVLGIVRVIVDGLLGAARRAPTPGKRAELAK